jgi:hypothetical protein
MIENIDFGQFVLFKHYSLQSFFFINTTYDRTDYGVFIMHIYAKL